MSPESTEPILATPIANRDVQAAAGGPTISPPDATREAASYNEVPYPSFAFRKSHPDHLYTLGRLFGLQPADTSSCRTLEIGCAAGGNLLPMADQLPQAQFVGLDYSDVQVRQAQALIDRSGLDNVQVWQADVSRVDVEALGQFDYIICHGVYSWVPEEVREAILRVCFQCLRPHGIAFVSFNTYPGWHFRGMIRDMMRFHVRQFTRPQIQINQARALLHFLAENVDENTAYGRLLKSELNSLGDKADSYLYHEHLEAHNEPVYFHVFEETVRKYQLQYLGDAEIASMWLGNFPGSIAETIQRIAPDLVHQEQYSDFLRNRTFRQALLCHQNLQPDRHINAAKVADARFYAPFRPDPPEPPMDLKPGIVGRFVNLKNEAKIATPFALVKAALLHLGEVYPRSVSLTDLWEHAVAVTDVPGAREPETAPSYRQHLADELIKFFVGGVLDIRFAPDYFITEIRERPTVSPLVRAQAEHETQVTSRRHEMVTLGGGTHRFLPLLDGTRDRSRVVEDFSRIIESGELSIGDPKKGRTEDPQKIRELVTRALDNTLNGCAKNALLVA